MKNYNDMVESIYSTICNKWKGVKEWTRHMKPLGLYTHTHTIHFLNKGESVALCGASFEVGACNVMAISVCFVALIDDS